MLSPYIFLKKNDISFICNKVEGANSCTFWAIVSEPLMRSLHLIKLRILHKKDVLVL